MAIETNEYIKYDSTNRYYYFTPTGAESLAGLDSVVWGDYTEKRLKRIGRLLRDFYIKSRFNKKELRYRHRDIVEYNIYKNEYGEYEAIKDAMINFIDLAEQMDLDLNYLDGTVKELPKSITDPLYNAGIYDKGELTTPVPEDEFRVDY